MSFPDFEADPAERVATSAGHVDAALILEDGLFAHGTLLHRHGVDPLVLFVSDHLFPVLKIDTLQRVVRLLSTESADFSAALASENWVVVESLIEDKCLGTALPRTHPDCPAHLTVLATEQCFKVLLDVRRFLPERLHQVVVGAMVTVLILTLGEQLIELPISVVDPEMVPPTLGAKLVSAWILKQQRVVKTHLTVALLCLRRVVWHEPDHLPARSIEGVGEVFLAEVAKVKQHEVPPFRQGSDV